MMAFLQSAFLYVAPFLIVISLIVTIHELGHLLTAKACGVAIDCFSLGFGRALFSWRDKSGMEWRIGWLPLGGYVRFAGDENVASVPDYDDLAALRRSIVAREGLGAELKYLPFKPLWQRTLIVLAGPAANFGLGIVLFAAFSLAFGEPVSTSRISQVVPGSAAARAGFQPGDLVVRADSKPIRTFEDLQFYVQYRGGVPIDFSVERGGGLLHLVARPDIRQVDSAFGGKQGVGVLGLGAQGGRLEPVNPIQALGLGVQKTWDVTGTTLFYLGRIVTGQVAADQLHSFFGIGAATGSLTNQAVDQAQAAGVNWAVAIASVLIPLAALISVSMGILNLMPIPVLDGGHLLSFAYEAIARRPPAAAVQAAGYRVGLALLVGLMLFATWNDLGRLKVFHFFGSLFS
jgi:regulator of sigma E protease